MLCQDISRPREPGANTRLVAEGLPKDLGRSLMSERMAVSKNCYINCFRVEIEPKARVAQVNLPLLETLKL